MSRKLFFITVILLLTTVFSYGHDWYSYGCCSNNDCHPITSCSEIIDKGKGFLQWDKYTFSPEQVHPSQDGQCHVCIHNYSGPTGEDLRPLCIYTQQNS